jgi:hypothetical protein
MPSACALLYFHLWPVLIYHIFPHYLIKGTIVGKSYGTKFVFWFSLQILSETFLILSRIQRDINKHVCTLHLKCPSLLPDFNRPLIISTEFLKMLKFRSHENPCSRIRVVLYGRVDRKVEANSIFRNFMNAPKTNNIFCASLLLFVNLILR